MFGKKDDKPAVMINANGDDVGYVDLKESKPKSMPLEIIKGSVVGFVVGTIPASLAAAAAAFKFTPGTGPSRAHPYGTDPTAEMRSHGVAKGVFAFTAISGIASAIGGLLSAINTKNHNTWAERVNTRALQEKAAPSNYQER